MEKIPAHLVRQANRLLDAIPDRTNPLLEIAFDKAAKKIVVWNMLADHERVVGAVRFEEGEYDI